VASPQGAGTAGRGAGTASHGRAPPAFWSPRWPRHSGQVLQLVRRQVRQSIPQTPSPTPAVRPADAGGRAQVSFPHRRAHLAGVVRPATGGRALETGARPVPAAACETPARIAGPGRSASRKPSSGSPPCSAGFGRGALGAGPAATATHGQRPPAASRVCFPRGRLAGRPAGPG